MITVPRTLPVRLQPVPGEALDSWLEAVACRLDTPLGDVMAEFGLPVRPNTRGACLLDIPWEWTILLRSAEVDAIAKASGLTPGRITGMTLAHYDQRAVVIDSVKRQVARGQLWGRGRASRFCPDCLAVTGGRWQLSWRLSWSFACTIHHRLLADRCPGCHRVQRERPHSRHAIPKPGRCACRQPGTNRNDPVSRCHHELAAAKPCSCPRTIGRSRRRHCCWTCSNRASRASASSPVTPCRRPSLSRISRQSPAGFSRLPSGQVCRRWRPVTWPPHTSARSPHRTAPRDRPRPARATWHHRTP
ncbi:TniQ family protein [Kitasatospora aburaviensis]